MYSMLFVYQYMSYKEMKIGLRIWGMSGKNSFSYKIGVKDGEND